MANQPGLNPTYQALYDAQLPQLQLAAQQAQQARGMFYSGNAVDMQTKAQADLLAKLLAQQATDTQQQTLQANQIAQAQSAQENQTKAQTRATNMGLIGSGVGAGATLLGMKLMGNNGVRNIFQSGGNTYTLDSSGKATLVNLPDSTPPAVSGVGGPMLSDPTSGFSFVAGSAPSAGGGLDGLAGVGPTPSPAGVGAFNAPGGGNGMGGFNPGAAATPASVASPGASAPVASMWNDPMQAAGGLGMGLAGGAGGYLAANQVNGGGKNTALASGLGGLAGLAGGALASSGNPYAAGAGALLGSFGGGLLGNLFK